MIETIEVKKRDTKGSRAMIKIRESGAIPAILYGHGEENVCLSVSLDTINNLIKHGTKLVNLRGDITDTALLRAVQWSSMGDYIIHVDFARVSQTETVVVTVPVHLHGEAPGAMSAAGQLRFVSHELSVRCPASKIPEFITCEIGHLQLGQAVHVNELMLPEGVVPVTPGSIVVAQVVAAAGADVEASVPMAAEPELIRKEKATEAGA
ncbi:MAG: 50S ribosomal protein L25 [Planctomycetota bacterium]|jgi:large subunit ribosomal protein L25